VLKASTLATVAAASRIAAPIHLLVAGHGCASVAEEGSRITGVEKVLLADAPWLADRLAENLAPVIVALAAGCSHVFAPASSFGKNVLPRAAALLGVSQISDIVEVISADTFVRPIYAGNALATVQSADPVVLVTVRVSAFELAARQGGCVGVEAVDAGSDLGVSRVLSRELSNSGHPELASAKVIVAGGRGLGSAESFHTLLDPLADQLGAAIGATRSAVDAGYVTNDCQVGQTGKIVAPELYVAVGISGAIQHLAGIRGSRTIVAINKDPDAPIFDVADYGLVGDLFEILPQLAAALRS
jgi:electron transfer flavoprotein alpha subunit